MITEKDIENQLDFEVNRSDIIIGAIAGDMIGSLYEFSSIKTVDFPLFSKESHFTDDTVMTIAVLEALLDFDKLYGFYQRGGFDLEKLKDLFVSSMKSYGALYPKAGYGERFSRWLTSGSREPYNSFGNGAAMRVSPVGAYFYNS